MFDPRPGFRSILVACLASLLSLIAPAANAGDDLQLIPYSGCGLLTMGVECAIFVGDDGTSFTMPYPTEFQVGDHVHVTGNICPGCFSICQQAVPFVPQSIDECPPVPVPGDANGDGLVNFDDIVVIIGAWGPCADCPADLTGDSMVNFDDVLIVLMNWS